MDFISVLIFISIIASMLLMIIGPILELKGKILFLENKNLPRTKGRYGMVVMAVGAILFLGGCISRCWLSSSGATVIVFTGFILWFIGGFISVIRNEVIKALEKEAE